MTVIILSHSAMEYELHWYLFHTWSHASSSWKTRKWKVHSFVFTWVVNKYSLVFEFMTLALIKTQKKFNDLMPRESQKQAVNTIILN